MKRYVKYFVLIITLFLTFKINVNATTYTNMDTTFTIEYDYNYYSDNIKNFYQDLIDLHSDYYNLVIVDDFFIQGAFNNNYRLFLVPKNINELQLQIYYSYNVNSTSSGGSLQSVVINYSSIKYYSNNVFNTTNTIYQNFYNCYVNNSCSNYNTLSSNSSFVSNRQPIIPNNVTSYQFLPVPRNTDLSGYSNTSSVLYYSSIPVIFSSGISGSSSTNNYYNKSLKIEGITYGYGDEIPTYLSSVPLPNDNNKYFIQFDNQLNSVYSKLSVTNIDRYLLYLDFSTIDISSTYYKDYVTNNLKFIFSGRKNNNNNYYQYDNISCSFDTINSSIDSSNNDLIHFEFKNINCDSSVNLSNYDYIYVTSYLDYTNWNNNNSKSLVTISVNANYGNFTYNDYLGDIYDNYNNLSSNFRFLISTKSQTINNNNSVYVYSSNDSTYYDAYDLSTLEFVNGFGGIIEKDTLSLGNIIPTKINVNDPQSLTTNYGFIIFSSESNTNLSMFFNSNIVLSLKYNDSNLYYYDIDNQTFDNYSFQIYDRNNINSYNFDLGESFTNILSFNESLRLEITQFGALVSKFYFSLPLVVQLFILVSFNILLLKFLFKLISNTNGKE